MAGISYSETWVLRYNKDLNMDAYLVIINIHNKFAITLENLNT